MMRKPEKSEHSYADSISNEENLLLMRKSEATKSLTK